MLTFKEFNERALITKDKGKVFADGKPLKKLNVEAMEDNMAFMHIPEGIPFFNKPKGFTMVWFLDSDEFVKKLENGEADPLFFPPGRMYDFNSAPISDIWKIKDSKPFIGAIEAYVKEEEILIKMMSVRPGFKKNHINSMMIDLLKNQFPNKKIIYWHPTDDGKKFMKKYNKTDELEDITYKEKED